MSFIQVDPSPRKNDAPALSSLQIRKMAAYCKWPTPTARKGEVYNEAFSAKVGDLESIDACIVSKIGPRVSGRLACRRDLPALHQLPLPLVADEFAGVVNSPMTCGLP